MHCLKCGKETMENRVFCDDCQDGMARYPIKPGTPVQLPKRVTAAESKRNTSRKKVLTPEEQIGRLQKIIKWLALTAITLALALSLSVMLLLHDLESEPQPPATGQEYSPIGIVEEP